MNKSKYYSVNYFQKSRNLLLPLGLSNGIRNEGIQSYLFCDSLDEDILEYNLLVKVDKGVEIIDEQFLDKVVKVYEKEEFDIYVLDISEWGEDIDSFMKGEYSKYTEKAKKKILKAFNNLNGDNFIAKSELTGGYKFYVIFFPDQYKEEVAQELWEVHELFNTKAEAWEVVKEMKEFCAPYSKMKETLCLKKEKQKEPLTTS